MRFARYIYPYWDKQLILYFCMVFSVIFGLMHPYLTRLIIDYAFIGQDLHIFNMIVLAGVAVYLFSIPIELIQKLMGFFLKTRVSYVVRAGFYRHLQSLSLRFAQSRSTGEHLYRLGPDLEGVVGLIVDTLPSVIILAFRIALLLGICFWLSWPLTLAVLAITPVLYLHTHFFTKRLYHIKKDKTEKSQEISGNLQEALAQTKLIKLFGKERHEYNRYLRDSIDLIRLNIANARISLLQNESGRFINAVLVGGIAYILGYQVIKGYLTIGELTALTMYLFQLLSALRGIGGLYNSVVLKFIAMDRVVQTLDAEVEVKEDPKPVRLRYPIGKVSFKDVIFGYKEGNPVLRGVNFDVRAGETIVLSGVSGTGKTTITNLLCRLYDPWEGSILIDGHDIRKIKLRDLRKIIGVASNDSAMMMGTVGDNIRFGNPDATAQEVSEAARIAEAHDFVMNLENGYDTEVGEIGNRLSQGQRQRIAIARALLRKPVILVLDEALSSLNPEMEQRIADNIVKSTPDRITIIVTHRPSIISKADHTLVLNNNGRVTEQRAHYDAERLLQRQPGIAAFG